MNKQLKMKGNVVTSRGIEWCDYTWNVLGGCLHECQWAMPDGTIAECYAKTTAESIALRSYPEGFAHDYWRPEKLNEPLGLQTPAKIFLDSMSDLMGHWIPNWKIQNILDVATKCKQHIFQSLTKNAIRLPTFDYPQNMWVGFSTPPDFMWGKQLTQHMKDQMLDVALTSISQTNANVKFISVEPLSWDISSHLKGVDVDFINWVIIGAASKDGKTHHQPDPDHLINLLEVCDERLIPVFFKGNLECSPRREFFPNYIPTIFNRSDFPEGYFTHDSV